MPWLGLDTAEWAQVGSAGFAAVAAGASWASVAQNRRERVRHERPDVHMEVLQRVPSNAVDLHFANFGGPAKKVMFCVVEGRAVAYGFLPPNSALGAGESRTVTTALAGTPDAAGVGFFSYFDARGRRMYVSALNGKNRTYRLGRWGNRRRSVSHREVMEDFYPEVNVLAMDMVHYDVKQS